MSSPNQQPDVRKARDRIASAKERVRRLNEQAATSPDSVQASDLVEARAELDLAELALAGANRAADQAKEEDRRAALDAARDEAACDLADVSRQVHDAVERAAAAVREVVALATDDEQQRARLATTIERLGDQRTAARVRPLPRHLSDALSAVLWPALEALDAPGSPRRFAVRERFGQDTHRWGHERWHASHERQGGQR